MTLQSPVGTPRTPTIFRRQPPVRSPLSWHALLAGVGTGLWSTAAERARADVESWIRRRFGCGAVVLTDSGTSALALALVESGRGHERPVAIPAYGCFDLATAVDASGEPFMLYDLDPRTLGPDLDSLRRTLELGADRVVIAHLYGHPVDMAAIRAIAAEYGASVIEDAAQAMGARLDGRPLGSFGDLSILSFGRGKGLTGGGGGALLLSSPFRPVELSPPTRGRIWRSVLTLAAQWTLTHPRLYWIPAAIPALGLGETRYQAPHQPTPIRRVSLGVLASNLRQVDHDAMLRRARANRYVEALKSTAARTFDTVVRSEPGFLRFPVLVDSETVARVMSRRATSLGVMPGYPDALCDLGGFGARRMNPNETFPGARRLAKCLFTVPTHAGLREEDIRALERWLGDLSRTEGR